MLKHFLPIPLCLLLVPAVHANPAEAERIKRGFELSSEKWMLEMNLATEAESREELASKSPKPGAAACEIWKSIQQDLDQDWTIPYAAFFLDITRNLTPADAEGKPLPSFREEREKIIETFSRVHLEKPGVEPFIVALIDSGEPQALPVLEKIAVSNPDESIQGIAALGAALRLKSLGDEPELMAKRLNFLRDAIIKSADRNIRGTSVADVASDELYVIRYLGKGRTAPALIGPDVGSRQVKLSDFKGRTVVLLFWDAKSPETDKVIRLTNQLVAKYQDKPVTILGITPEPAERIRSLQGEGAIKWNNLPDPAGKLSSVYRIVSRPAVFVIDSEGRIQYTGLPGSFVELTVDALLNPEKK